MHLNVEQIIEQALGDEIPAAAAHVRACAECEAEVQAYRDVWALTRDVPVPPPGYADKIWTRVQWRLGPPPRRRRWPTILAIAASVMLAVVAGLLIWRERQAQPTIVTPPQAQTQTTPEIRSKMSVTVTPPVADPVLKEKLDVVHNTTNLHKLADIARHEPLLEVRLEAIRALGALRGSEACRYLVEIYPNEKEPDARRTIGMALLLQGDPASVEALTEMETDPAVKREIAGMLDNYRATEKWRREREEGSATEPARRKVPR